MPTMNVLQAQRLHYAYHTEDLFQPVSFHLESGQGLVLRGPNGSGKSTLLQVIAGLRTQYQGNLLWNTQTIKPDAFRMGLLYIGHKPALQMKLTVREMLNYFGLLYGRARTPNLEGLLTTLQLDRVIDAPIHTLSAGQCKKVSLMRLAMMPSQLCLLDEPFSSLDLISAQSVTTLIQQQRAAGSIILLSSHGQDGLDFPELSLIPC